MYSLYTIILLKILDFYTKIKFNFLSSECTIFFRILPRRSASVVYLCILMYVFTYSLVNFFHSYTCSRWGWRRILRTTWWDGRNVNFCPRPRPIGCRVCAQKYVISITPPLLYASYSYVIFYFIRRRYFMLVVVVTWSSSVVYNI